MKLKAALEVDIKTWMASWHRQNQHRAAGQADRYGTIFVPNQAKTRCDAYATNARRQRRCSGSETPTTCEVRQGGREIFHDDSAAAAARGIRPAETDWSEPAAFSPFRSPPCLLCLAELQKLSAFISDTKYCRRFSRNENWFRETRTG